MDKLESICTQLIHNTEIISNQIQQLASDYYSPDSPVGQSKAEVVKTSEKFGKAKTIIIGMEPLNPGKHCPFIISDYSQFGSSLCVYIKNSCLLVHHSFCQSIMGLFQIDTYFLKPNNAAIITIHIILHIIYPCFMPTHYPFSFMEQPQFSTSLQATKSSNQYLYGTLSCPIMEQCPSNNSFLITAINQVLITAINQDGLLYIIVLQRWYKFKQDPPNKFLWLIINGSCNSNTISIERSLLWK